MSGQFRIDIVTVTHNATNAAQAVELHRQIAEVEPGGWRFITVDNSVRNRGFAKGCNWGAFHPDAKAPIVGFLNPDASVGGPFIRKVEQALANTKVVITGCRFEKPQDELDIWGVQDWVCGAAFFVDRKWFTEVGGFDESYTWGWEETDLIRQAEKAGLVAKSIHLPITHASPSEDSPVDAEYKRLNFERSRNVFNNKWRTSPRRRTAQRGGRRAV